MKQSLRFVLTTIEYTTSPRTEVVESQVSSRTVPPGMPFVRVLCSV